MFRALTDRMLRTRKASRRRSTYLIVSQVFVPDPTSVGQHMADVADGLAERGHRVKVITSRRGYSDPAQVYPRKTNSGGVVVRRLGLSSFGKGSLTLRLLAQSLFLLQATVLGVFTRRLQAILISTSPPTAGIAGLAISALRRVPLRYWVMDLNPDQAVEMGVVDPDSRSARALDYLNRRTLDRCDVVITLDEHMAGRLRSKADVREKLLILPPWPHNSPERLSAGESRFRAGHDLEDKFVVMYSGNHSPAHPLTTLLAAARELADDDRFRFVFIGGGLTKRDVDAAAQSWGHYVVSLPYQPLDHLSDSLGAADVHVVTMGDNMVGCVHPTKVYGALAAGKPVLFVGPGESHVGALITEHGVGWHFEHGDYQSLAARLRALVEMPPGELAAVGERAAELMTRDLSRSRLQERFLDAITGTR